MKYGHRGDWTLDGEHIMEYTDDTYSETCTLLNNVTPINLNLKIFLKRAFK